MPARKRIALIVDNRSVASWQADALLQIAGDTDFILLNCTNTRLKRRAFRHASYYVLNLVSLKSPVTKRVPLPAALEIVQSIDFEAEQDGAWQRLPTRVLELLKTQKPEAAIKFGMGLLRVPDELECRILSYHHGDPRRFRGRPAGFYEMLGGVPTVGQIVQIISNRLDAGAVVAFGETRTQMHSYRATMAQSYRASPLLLQKALRNCLSGKVLPIEPSGRNYRLPSNWAVARFAVKLIVEKLRRLSYGALFEKAWEVASAEVGSTNELLAGMPLPASWRTVSRPRRYQFLADPFPHPRNGVLVEALRRRDGQGEIVHFGGDREEVLCSGSGHFSYPASVKVGTDWFMIPEVSEWTRPRAYRLTDDGCEPVAELKIDGAPRLVDATVHAADDGIYLFGNIVSEGSEVLRLWTADSLFSDFVEHPESPIQISPAGGRMGGALLRLDGRLYRVGQDCSRGYGERVILFEIRSLSRGAYEEVRAGELTLDDVNGPHTLNVRDRTLFFDFYRDRFTALAGVRRIRAALAKRKALAAGSITPERA